MGTTAMLMFTLSMLQMRKATHVIPTVFTLGAASSTIRDTRDTNAIDADDAAVATAVACAAVGVVVVLVVVADVGGAVDDDDNGDDDGVPPLCLIPAPPSSNPPFRCALCCAFLCSISHATTTPALRLFDTAAASSYRCFPLSLSSRLFLPLSLLLAAHVPYCLAAYIFVSLALDLGGPFLLGFIPLTASSP